MDTFSAFLNPFDTEKEHLVCIPSGQKVPEDVADDPLKVEDVGKKSFKEFVDTRLKDKTTRFHKPLTKTKLKTFGSVSKSTQIKSAKNVVKIKAERNVFNGQLLVLSQEYQIHMEKVLKYPLSPVQWSLSSPDGLPLSLKTNKAALLHKLENTFTCNCFESQDFSRQPNTAYIIDESALLHCLSSGPDTFGDLAKQAFCSLPQTASVHFVTDTYKLDSCEISERGHLQQRVMHYKDQQQKFQKISRNFCLMMETGKL
ncbi:hypothetical protein PoB_004841100 [Plakobranchus ocellatus]|uniref:Uncharacterized protein n=1 Tax=Plakobranchus ocellatus TaxID=259542 RepID=A0AAV4BN72_9GAST|nr:hypothetical protein PoB_004841100 [Plakobranchus ocellatus]